MVGDSPETGAQRHRAEVAEARPGWYFWLIMATVAVLGPSIAIWISRENQHRSEQAWCEVISVMDDAYRASPPTSPVGLRIAAAMARLRVAYDCP